MFKIARRTGIVAAAISAAALMTPALAGAFPTGSLGSPKDTPKVGFTCSALSTESTPNGWGIPFDDEKSQKAFYSATNVNDKDGSLHLKIVEAAPDNRSVAYHSAGSIKLSDAIKSEIGFSELAPTSRASFQLRLSGTTNPIANENGFATVYWVANGNTADDTIVGGSHANLQDGQWISTRALDGVAKNVPTSLADIAESNPDATVEHYGLSIGRGSSENTETHVDAVKFNGCTTNFAKNDPKPPTSTGSLGNLFGS